MIDSVDCRRQLLNQVCRVMTPAPCLQRAAGHCRLVTAVVKLYNSGMVQAYLSDGDGGCRFWQPVQAESQPKSSGLVFGRRPHGTILHSSNEPGELSQWLCHDDSTINIVLNSIILYYYYVIYWWVTCYFIVILFCCLWFLELHEELERWRQGMISADACICFSFYWWF